MADGNFPSLVSKDINANAVANPIWVELTDGTTAIGVTSNALDVNVTNTVISIDDNGGSITVDGTVAISGTVAVTQSGSWTVGISGISDGTDSLDINADGSINAVVTDGGGSITVDGTVTVTDGGGSLTVDLLSEKVDDAAFTVATDSVLAIGALADETATDLVDEGDIGIPRMTLDRKLIIEIADATTDSQRLKVNSDGSLDVNIVSGALSSGEVHDYDTAAGVASLGTSNHDYTVTGSGTNATFLLDSVIWSGSGNVKVEIQTGPLASLATVAVGFLTDRQGDTKQLFFDPPVEVPVTSTGTVRVIRTNRQGAATDVYSTIIGREV